MLHYFLCLAVIQPIPEQSIKISLSGVLASLIYYLHLKTWFVIRVWKLHVEAFQFDLKSPAAWEGEDG